MLPHLVNVIFIILVFLLTPKAVEIFPSDHLHTFEDFVHSTPPQYPIREQIVTQSLSEWTHFNGSDFAKPTVDMAAHRLSEK